MKRKRWLWYILAASLVLSSCQAVNPGMDGQKTDGGYGTGDEIGHGSGNESGNGTGHESGNETGNAPGHEPGQSPQPGGMESAPGQDLTAGQDPVVISEAARNLGADNGILTGTFFQAGDIRRRLTLRPAKGGMESEWLECGFSVQDENHADAFSGTGSAGILTEKGKVSYEIRPQAYGADEGNGSEAPVYTVTFHVPLICRIDTSQLREAVFWQGITIPWKEASCSRMFLSGISARLIYACGPQRTFHCSGMRYMRPTGGYLNQIY